jgi:hypothetical protein
VTGGRRSCVSDEKRNVYLEGVEVSVVRTWVNPVVRSAAYGAG